MDRPSRAALIRVLHAATVGDNARRDTARQSWFRACGGRDGGRTGDPLADDLRRGARRRRGSRRRGPGYRDRYFARRRPSAAPAAAAASAVTPGESAADDAAFLTAKAAFDRGDFATLDALAPALESYPLALYVR